jgi:hypothetical protein
MEVIVNPLREYPADAIHASEIGNASLTDPLQSAELPKKCSPSLRTQALN